MSPTPDSQHVGRILDLVTATDETTGKHDLCRAGVEVLGVAGVSIMLRVDGQPTPVCASNALAADLEDLQQTLGEGPGIDADVTGRPVAEPDLAASRVERWAGFGPAALEAGASALFSFPLRLGAVRLGAITVYQSSPGGLSDRQHTDGLVMAIVMFNVILAMQTGAPPGALTPTLATLADYRAEVHQASGMVSIQLGVSVGDALVRLRAYAYAEEMPLAEVAGAVVERRLRLDD